MKELKSHTLDFDALEGWCGNFYTRRTQVSKTRVLLLILHFWETEKKKEGEEEERRKEEEEDTLPTAKPNPPHEVTYKTQTHLQQSHPTYSHLSGKSVMDLPIGKVAVLLGAGLSMLSLFFSDSPFFFFKF